MTIAEKYKKALTFIEQGDKVTAAGLLREVWNESPDDLLKLDVGARMLSLLNRIDDHKELLVLCDSVNLLGSKLGKSDASGYALGMKALTLAQELPSCYHRQKCITFPPDWFCFALEREKVEFKEIEKKIVSIEAEAAELFKRAEELSVTSPEARAHIYHFETQVHEIRITKFDFQNMRTSWLHPALKLLRVDRYFIFRGKAKKERKKLLKEVGTLYRRSIKAYRTADDEGGVGYVYFSWALQHKMQFHFIKAKIALWKAERVAKKLNDQLLLKQIEILKKSLALKNKDISGDHVEYEI